MMQSESLPLIQNLSNEELKALLTREPNLLVLDVRTAEEFYFLGHLPQARLLPMHLIPEQMAELDPMQPTVVLCEHGVRSVNVATYLQAHGFQSLFNLTDGMAGWDGPRECSRPGT